MPNFRRRYVPGGTIFFALVTDQRRLFLCEQQARALLHAAIAACRQRWPFVIDAMVLLPDHLHTIWILPVDDMDYSRRWAFIKKEFTKAWLAAGGAEQVVTEGRNRDGRRGVWQPKFWDHAIRDEGDYERHFDYIHYNPVKHGLVRRPQDWPYSTFHRWVKAGVYPLDWGCPDRIVDPKPFRFDDLKDTTGE